MAGFIDGPTPLKEDSPIPVHRQMRANAFTAYSAKMRRLMQFESFLEFCHFVILEFDMTVVEIKEQPIKINEVINGNMLNYTFDLFVRWRNGKSKLIEVKPTAKLTKKENGIYSPAKWDVISVWADKNGHEIDFYTEEIFEDGEQKTMVNNLIQILPYIQSAQEGKNIDLRKNILLYLDQPTPTKLCDVSKRFNDYSESEVLGCVFELLHLGHVKIPALKKMNVSMVMEVYHEDKIS